MLTATCLSWYKGWMTAIKPSILIYLEKKLMQTSAQSGLTRMESLLLFLICEVVTTCAPSVWCPLHGEESVVGRLNPSYKKHRCCFSKATGKSLCLVRM